MHRFLKIKQASGEHGLVIDASKYNKANLDPPKCSSRLMRSQCAPRASRTPGPSGVGDKKQNMLASRRRHSRLHPLACMFGYLPRAAPDQNRRAVAGISDVCPAGSSAAQMSRNRPRDQTENQVKPLPTRFSPSSRILRAANHGHWAEYQFIHGRPSVEPYFATRPDLALIRCRPPPTNRDSRLADGAGHRKRRPTPFVLL